jgi:hypothetical protein
VYMCIPALGGFVLARGYAWTTEYLTFLTDGYHTHLAIPRAWECFVLLRKSLLVGLSTSLLLLKDTRAQLAYTMFLLSGFVALQVHYKPLSSLQLNLLETLALVSELAFAFTVMIRQQGSSGEKTFTKGGVATAAAVELARGAVALREVSEQERLLFDVIAAALAALFIFAWFFVVANDKLYSGRLLKMAVLAWERAAAAAGSVVNPLFGALGCAGGARGGGGGGGGGAAAKRALHSRQLLEPVTITYRWGWQLICDPDGMPMWVPPAVVDLKYLPPEERAKLQSLHGLLPLDGKTAGGWYRLDPRRLNAASFGTVHEWANDGARVEATTAYPAPEPPAAPPVGPWTRFLPPVGPPVWMDTVTQRTEAELPEWEVTARGWSRVRNIVGRPFWLRWRDMRAQWALPRAERRAVLRARTPPPRTPPPPPERPRTPPPPPPLWMALWDDAGGRALAWVEVEAGGGGRVARVALGAPPRGAALAGGWRFEAGGAPGGAPGGVFLHDGDGAHSLFAPLEARAPRAAAAAALAAAGLNVWAQARDRRGRLAGWANLATGDAQLLLPPGAVTVEGWRAEPPAPGSRDARYSDLRRPDAPPRERLPPAEVAHALHWLPAASRWALCARTGGWRRLRTPPQDWASPTGGGVGAAMWAPPRPRRAAAPPQRAPLVPPRVGDTVDRLLARGGEGGGGGVGSGDGGSAGEDSHDSDGASGLPSRVANPSQLPLGAVTRGGWRLIAAPGEPRGRAWLHPGLAELRHAAPTAEEEAAGVAAREAAEAAGWAAGARRGDAEAPPLLAPPARPSPTAAWRLAPAEGGASAAHLPWVQDGTGARRAVPPPGAALPGGWALAEREGGAGEALHVFVHAESGAAQSAVPDFGAAAARAAAGGGVAGARAGDERLWGRVRDERGLRVWEHFTSGRRLGLTESPPIGAVLRGGWEVVAGDRAPNNAGVHSLLFHAGRHAVRGWDHLPEEADADWQRGWQPPPPQPLPPLEPERPSAALAYLEGRAGEGASGDASGGGDAPPWVRFLPDGGKRHVWRCGGATAARDEDLPLGAATADEWVLVGNEEGERWWRHGPSGEVAWRGPWEAAEAEARARRREAKRAAEEDKSRRKQRRRQRRAEWEGDIDSSSAAESRGDTDNAAGEER